MSYTPKNLYPPIDANSYYYDSYTKLNEKYLGQDCYTPIVRTCLANYVYLTPGVYTFSIYARESQNCPCTFYVANIGSDMPHHDESCTITPANSPTTLTVDNQWHRYSFTFTVTAEGWGLPRFSPQSSSYSGLSISAPQLEVGDTATDFEPYNCTWYIGLDGELHNTNFIDLPSVAMATPYPHALWRIDEGFNDGLPYNMLMVDVPAFGAFANATSLAVIRIPRSVKSIGVETFRNTNLISVTIASDCTYYDTSFPEGCVVNFYPD